MSRIAAWLARHRTRLALAAMLLVLALGLAALHHLTREVHLRDLQPLLESIEPTRLALCLAFAAASYLALTFYDLLALRIVGRPLPWRTAALASFTSYTLSHNLGLGWLTGGSARYRVYTAAGLDGPDVARVIAIASATFWMGVLLVAGFALLLHQGPVAIAGLSLAHPLAQALGAVILALGTGFVLLCARGPRMLRLFGWTLPLPSAPQALAQYGVAALDLAAASAALFVLVPGADPVLLPTFILAYALALVVALLSHVPGGVGVFEAVLIAALPGDKTALLAALIVYRLLYYLLPLALGILLLLASEGRHWRAPAARAMSGARALVSGVAPLALAAASVAGGAVLLLSGSLPAVPARLHALHAFVPLPFIEASHIVASLAGTGLVLLAPGLYRRLDGAFVAARALLLAGALFSLAKGIDYEEALVCLSIAALLQWTRPAFYRRTALTAQPLSVAWIAAAGAMLAVAVWVGLFAYKHVAYKDQLWWEFALHGNASRFLRASLAASLFLAAIALWRLLSPARVAAPPGSTEIGAIRPLLPSARRADAMLALAGDKRFLISASGDAFLMYQVKGASWIVMADPVGPRAQWADLLWEIRAMADAAQGRLLLYEISIDALALAVELGLQVMKYGEEAIVDLADFSLDGSAMRSLRQANARAEREGLVLDIVPATEVPALIPELAPISAAWLALKGQSEKGFSLGRFDSGYLAEFPCAVIRRDGEALAFANIWATADRSEISIDLMRHRDDAPSGTMDFLFVHLMLWAREQGYARFSLGLAPLSGIAARPLAPGWAKAAALMFNHGERFYGFRGLRDYKSKFNPLWQPRYIAGPHGLGMVLALNDLNALVGAGPPAAR